jgi:HEAT repeat protein
VIELFVWRRLPVRVQTGLVLSLGLLACGGCAKGQKPTEQMITELKSPSPRDRIVAVRLLPERQGDAEHVVPALIEALKDKSDDVRWSAAIGLGRFGVQAKDAIPALQEATHDPDARVREGAGVALSRIDPERFSSPTKAARAK